MSTRVKFGLRSMAACMIRIYVMLAALEETRLVQAEEESVLDNAVVSPQGVVTNDPQVVIGKGFKSYFMMNGMTEEEVHIDMRYERTIHTVFLLNWYPNLGESNRFGSCRILIGNNSSFPASALTLATQEFFYDGGFKTLD